MSSFKEKSQGFIVGILVGLIVAGGFFIFKLDDYFKELNFYKSLSGNFSSDSKVTEPETNQSNVNPEKEKKQKVKTVQTSKEENDSEGVVVKSDSTKIEKDSLILENPSSDDVVVRKDELLSTKTLEVINMDPVAKITGKDSLLMKVSGIKDDRNSSKQFLNIEFWSSPLNYKGYKMSKYKLIVYGVSSPEGLKVFKLDDVMYLKSSSFVYRLDTSGDFKPYERITDELIISRLK